MKSLILLLSVLCCAIGLSQNPIQYPFAYASAVQDTLWGKVVKDPYRWFEDLDSDSTKKWIESESAITKKYLGTHPSEFKNYLEKYATTDQPRIQKIGNYFFTHKWVGNHLTSAWYYQHSEIGNEHFLFNPNDLANKEKINVTNLCISKNNATLAIVLDSNGSDWKNVRFMDMNTREWLKDEIKNIKYSTVFWHKDGVFYLRFNTNNRAEAKTGLIQNEGIYYHKLGTPNTEDLLVYKSPNKDYLISFYLTAQGNYLIVPQLHELQDKTYQQIMIAPINDSLIFNFKLLIIKKYNPKEYFYVIGEYKNKILVQTNVNAVNGILNLYEPLGLNSGTAFTQQFKQRLISSRIVGDKVVSIYDGVTELMTVRDSTGKILQNFEIPENYAVNHMQSNTGDSILYYSFSSYISPSSNFKLNVNSLKNESVPYLRYNDKKGTEERVDHTYIPFDNSIYTTEKVYYYSKDSTLVPMYITHLKNIKLDGQNPTVLYGYGGFGVSMRPSFNLSNILLLKNGGILAVPCIRGGGELPGWHEAGMRLNKERTFDDFIAAAEYLIDHHYTNPKLLAAMGGSNGGLTVGASALRRPDLFKAIVSEAGELDMLRYHLFNIGYEYKEEYGNVKDSLDFINLLHFSPVNNVKKGCAFPATLLTTGDNDDRVMPFSSFKFLAALQNNAEGPNPYLLYYEKQTGHGGNGTYDNFIRSETAVYSFIIKNLWEDRHFKYLLD